MNVKGYIYFNQKKLGEGGNEEFDECQKRGII
jgi:hypothetical protein